MKDLIYKVKGCCLDIHRVLGPGLFEKVYQTALVYELRQSGFNIKTEVKIPIIYKGIKIDEGFRADIIVDDNLIVELKAIESINPIHYVPIKDIYGSLRHSDGAALSTSTRPTCSKTAFILGIYSYYADNHCLRSFKKST